MLDATNSVILYSSNEDNNIVNDKVSVANSQNISVKSAKCHLYKEKTRRKLIFTTYTSGIFWAALFVSLKINKTNRLRSAVYSSKLMLHHLK